MKAERMNLDDRQEAVWKAGDTISPRGVAHRDEGGSCWATLVNRRVVVTTMGLREEAEGKLTHYLARKAGGVITLHRIAGFEPTPDEVKASRKPV